MFYKCSPCFTNPIHVLQIESSPCFTIWHRDQEKMPSVSDNQHSVILRRMWWKLRSEKAYISRSIWICFILCVSPPQHREHSGHSAFNIENSLTLIMKRGCSQTVLIEQVVTQFEPAKKESCRSQVPFLCTKTVSQIRRTGHRVKNHCHWHLCVFPLHLYLFIETNLMAGISYLMTSLSCHLISSTTHYLSRYCWSRIVCIFHHRPPFRPHALDCKTNKVAFSLHKL